MRILITAGPTHEPIDRVRFIGNRSSGKMGIAIAKAGVAAGHEVTLLLGPIGKENHELGFEGATIFRFVSSTELKQMLEVHFRDCDLLIMAAAVADYRPTQVAEGKLPRDKKMTIELMATPDLVALTAKGKRDDQRVIAFALEEQEQLLERATAKMKRKGVDGIIANPLSTMESGKITATYLGADGGKLALETMDKDSFAAWLMDHLATD